MSLTQQDFKRIIENPVNNTYLVFADADNARMAFHSRRATSVTDISTYYTHFKAKIDEILIPSKKKPFWALFEFPLPTNEIISDATDELNKVFIAKDRVIEINCTHNETKQDFEVYEQKRISSFVKNELFNAVLERCNSFVLIDLPKEQTSQLPEPYAIIIEAKNIYDIDFNPDGTVKYLCLKKPDDIYYFIDDIGYYRLKVGSEVVIESVQTHGLGYCPVSPIWNDSIDETGVRKLSPLIDILALLDDYVFKYIQKKYLDLYADSPILEKYEESCSNPQCVDGYIITGENKTACEDCKSRAYIGAGSILTKPMPNAVTGNVETAAKWIAVPVDSLNYTKEKLEATQKRIYEFLTGYVKGTDKTEAVNQEQVYSQLESRKAKLSWWAENLEKIHKFILDTKGKLRYGDMFLSSTVDYGRDFHLWTLDTALKELESAQKVGLPMYLIAQMRDNVTDLITGSSSYKLQRVAILKLLEPYPDLHLNLVPKDTADYELKANFSRYIDLFEQKYGDIVNFASLIDMNKKVEKIRMALLAFVSESQKLQIESRKKFIEINNPQQQINNG